MMDARCESDRLLLFLNPNFVIPTAIKTATQMEAQVLSYDAECAQL